MLYEERNGVAWVVYLLLSLPPPFSPLSLLPHLCICLSLCLSALPPSFHCCLCVSLCLSPSFFPCPPSLPPTVALLNRMLQGLREWFWQDWLWFPEGMGWADLESRDGQVFSKSGDLWMSLPIALCFLVIRQIFEWSVYTHSYTHTNTHTLFIFTHKHTHTHTHIHILFS